MSGTSNLPKWTASVEGLRLGSILISFQRYSRPDNGVIEHAPSSLGALPVAVRRAARFLLPVGDDEAFWIGALVAPRLRGAEIEIKAIDQITRTLRTARDRFMQPGVIVGFPRADGMFDAFCRTLTSVLSICVDNRTVRLRLVDFETYSTSTGEPSPEPIDRLSGYRRWRLP